MTCSTRPRAPGARSGFTLIELLVVIAVIGVLIALLLPAVQAAREAARRISCFNNLHQMGIGLHNYHLALGSFPPGGIEPRMSRLSKGRQLAWSAFLLPYLEQSPLHGKIDFGKAFDAPENAAAAATVVSTYICPSSPRGSTLVEGRGPCDYGGIYGQKLIGSDSPPNGTMYYNHATTIAEIRDGTSNTLMISEDSGFQDGQWINGLNVFEVAWPINQGPAFDNEIRSKHPGGANGLFADGSARFLKESMDRQILAAICTRSGGEAVGEF